MRAPGNRLRRALSPHRWAAWLDDAARDVVYALRTFRRAPVAAATIVSTVALGLGLVTVAFTVLDVLVFRVDQVRNVHELYAVQPPRRPGDEDVRYTRAQFDALRRDTRIFTDAYAEVPDVDSRVDGRLIWGTFVTGNFFDVLGVAASRGRVLTPEDDSSSATQPVMVLSDRGWERLFARDPAIVGRRIKINHVDFEIVGVMPAGFRGLAFAADDYWAPLSALPDVRSAWLGHEADIEVDIVGRLRPDMTAAAAAAQLDLWDARLTNRDPGGRSASPLTLAPRQGTLPRPLEAVPITGPLFLAFGLILLIGCANAANLLLARSVVRQREIGIRLSIGASRQRIVRQLLTESFLLALLSAAAGFAISRLSLAAIVNAIMTTMPPDIGDVRLLVPEADWRMIVFLLAGALLSTFAFALAPALQATRVDPIKTIRGGATGNARSGRSRSLLIALQVSAATMLAISAAVFLRSAFAAAEYDPGLRTSDTLLVQIVNEPRRGAIVRAMADDASVDAIAAAWPDLMPRGAFAESRTARTRVGYKLVSPEYFDVLDVALVRGRAFTSAERRSSAAVAVVSETAARALWPDANAVGQVIRLDPDQSSTEAGDEPRLESRAFTVAGVVRNVPGFRFARFDEAVVYVPANVELAGTSLLVRVQGDPEMARQRLLGRIIAIDPDMGRQVTTLRTIAGMDSYFLQVGFWLTVVLGALALVLTLSGLFSVVSYLVEQRRREIGVRIALGATSRDVTGLILRQSFRPVGAGLVAGCALAVGVAALMLATPAAAMVGEMVRVLDPVAYTASVLTIVAACAIAAWVPAARAARLDPAVVLRQE